MLRLLLLIPPMALAACAPASAPPAGMPAAAPSAPAQQACDDGGSGGVLIDGVCL